MSTASTTHPAHTAPRHRNLIATARGFLAVFLVLHGFAHFVGTTGNLDHADHGGSVDVFGGAWTITDPAALRALAVAWAVVGVAVAVAGVLVWFWPARARTALLAVTAASLALSVSVWSDAYAGTVINVVLLLVVGIFPGAIGLRATDD